MEVKYDDEDLGLLLLCSLPSSFSNFRDTILYSHDELTIAMILSIFEVFFIAEMGYAQNDPRLILDWSSTSQPNKGPRKPEASKSPRSSSLE